MPFLFPFNKNSFYPCFGIGLLFAKNDHPVIGQFLHFPIHREYANTQNVVFKGV